MPSDSDPFKTARLEQLERDLARTPAERLRIAEELTVLARKARPKPPRRDQIIGFDTIEEFWEWKKANR
jgi:hypothetical protein